MSRRKSSLSPEPSLCAAAPAAAEIGAREGFAFRRRGLPSTLVSTLVWACIAWVGLSLGFGAEPAQAAAVPGHLHAAMRPSLSGKSRGVEVWADGAVLVNFDGQLGVRAWANHPGSCMGPAGPAAAKAARAAAEELIALASIKRSSELEVEGVMEVEQRTRRGVECAVEITVSRLERSRAASDAPKRARATRRSSAVPRTK